MYDLTICVEMTTGEITGRCDVSARLRAWIDEVTRTGRSAELLLVSPRSLLGIATLASPIPTRALIVEGAGYYALKNAGARAALGDLILLTDADCRPEPGYIGAMFRAFEDTRLKAAGGVSRYDGSGLLTRINSAQSFGDVRPRPAGPHVTLAHNVAVRRTAAGAAPFGPFTARVGGDAFFSRHFESSPDGLRIVPAMAIRHEDVSYSMRGLVERHLRECIVPLDYGRPSQRVSYPYAALCTLVLRPALRLKRLFVGGPREGLGLRHLPVALLLNFVYWLADIALVGCVLLVPRIRRERLRFQFGADGITSPHPA